jgi:hypothetical protein
LVFRVKLCFFGYRSSLIGYSPEAHPQALPALESNHDFLDKKENQKPPGRSVDDGRTEATRQNA